MRKSFGDESYAIGFTLRKAMSIWSVVNVSRVAVLIAQGRMQPAGLTAFAVRSDTNTSNYIFEQDAPRLTVSDVRMFKTNKAAWQFFEA